jgi:hypothetical protein
MSIRAPGGIAVRFRYAGLDFKENQNIPEHQPSETEGFTHSIGGSTRGTV